MKRVLVRYSGQVQGVGFRATARHLAGGFKVSGWVRNLRDGSVELVAAGEAAELEAFLQAIRGSGLGPHISREVTEPAPAGTLPGGFEIQY